MSTRGKKQLRSFKGCVACKERRKKCTEERPSCALCVRTGRNCEYRFDDLIVMAPQPASSSSSSSSSSSFSFTAVYKPVTSTFAFNVESKDERYLSFFFRRFESMVPLSNYFPGCVRDLFVMVTTHSEITEAVLSFGAFHLEHKRRQDHGYDDSSSSPDAHLIPVYHYTAKSFAMINAALNDQDEQLSTTQMDWVLVAIFIFVHLCITSGDHVTARHHLRGFKMLLRKRLRSAPPSKLIMFMYELVVVNDDAVAGSYAVKGVFRSCPDSRWYDVLAEDDGSCLYKCARAQIKLRRIVHEVIRLRRVSHNFVDLLYKETVSKDEYDRLKGVVAEGIVRARGQIAAWRQEVDSFIEPPMETSTAPLKGKFLNFPAIEYPDLMCARLMLSYHASVIHISMTENPMPGPVNLERVSSSVWVCRTQAFLRTQPGESGASVLTPLLMAGLCFGGGETYNHKAYRGWICDELLRIRYEYGTPSAMTTMGGLRATWMAIDNTVKDWQLTDDIVRILDTVTKLRCDEGKDENLMEVEQ